MVQRTIRKAPHPVIKWLKIIAIVGAAYVTMAAIATTVWNVAYKAVVEQSINNQINNKWTNEQKKQVADMIENSVKDMRTKVNCCWSVMTPAQKEKADALYAQFKSDPSPPNGK